LSKYLVSKRTPSTIPLSLVKGNAGLKTWLKSQPKMVNTWVNALKFKATAGTTCVVPDKDGSIARVLVGASKHFDPWQLAKLPGALPKGRYFLDADVDRNAANALSLGWALGTYQFARYKRGERTYSELVWPRGADPDYVTALAKAIVLGRDLINVPAEDMGPAELAAVAKDIATEFSATLRQVVGEDLLAQNYPAVHAVGRASSRPPRLIDIVWGDKKHPRVTLVGKGVCFDTGGLDIKPAESMKLMKKDMGGAATVLAVARAIMELRIKVRLRVLVPAVENSVSGNAFRPLDVLNTRKGLTVEVGHTDAEGRLILSDALAEACEDSPELLIDVATLTGAARVALGTSLPALFCNDDTSATELLESGERVHDPLWRLPLFAAYRSSLDSKVADLSNISPGPYAGAITAALFLKEFVSDGIPWMHIDTMAYNLTAQPGRPVGGEVFGVRAIVDMLESRYGR